MKSINVVIDDLHTEKEQDVETSITPEVGSEVREEVKVDTVETNPTPSSKGPSVRVQKNHPQDLIIGDPQKGITARRSNEVISNSCFVPLIEPKNIKEALTEECWIEAMQEELNQFKRSDVWDLVPDYGPASVPVCRLVIILTLVRMGSYPQGQRLGY
jgi:hypothetical protein